MPDVTSAARPGPVGTVRSADGLDEVAAVVHRLSVLLAAGVAPASALTHLAEADPSGAAGPPGAARRRRLLRSVALEASGAISDDGIIDPRDTRTVLGICLSVVRNTPIQGAAGYGVFRL